MLKTRCIRPIQNGLSLFLLHLHEDKKLPGRVVVISRMPQNILVWFKNDLRLCDHEPLWHAAREGNVLPIYVVDPRLFVVHELGFPRTGSFRARFLIESLRALREGLQAIGSNLAVRVGKPEEVLPALCQEHDIHQIYTSAEIADEEQRVMTRTQMAVKSLGKEVRAFENNALYRLRDLPWPIGRLPDVFTRFRNDVEKKSVVRAALPAPTALSTSFAIDWGMLPTVESLGLSAPVKDGRSVITFGGGEAEAWRRVQEYLWQKDLLRTYKETRNGLIGPDYSSKFSAALAHGCLSPRSIYEEVQRYERERIMNDSTYWLIFELRWREYFRWAAMKYGTRIFHREGIRQQPVEWNENKKWFEKWRRGETGVDFVDANMRELWHTGFMSNRGRQNVASYLTKDLKIDWRWGAAWFESQLIDYDVHSNWLNWAYVAGVGNDPREDRYFNIASQEQRYDPEGWYRQLWLS